MRKLLSLLLITGLLVSACGRNKCETVEGPRVSRTKSLKAVSKISLNLVASMSIKLDTSLGPRVEIIAQEDVIKEINATYSGSELSLGLDKCLKKHEEILFEAIVPDVAEITLTSAGKIESSSLIKRNSLRLSNEGLGDMDFVLSSSLLIAKIKSSGDITLAGATTKLDLLTTSSGDLHAYNFVADTINLNIVGSSVIEVFTNGTLNVFFHEPSVVRYRGNPTSIVIVGEGEVISADPL